MTPDIVLAALRAAHRELTMLQGLQVIDSVAAEHSIAVEVSGTIVLIESALAAVNPSAAGDVPEGEEIER